MFTEFERERLLEELVAAARGDDRVAAAALVGSLAAGRSDAWSDIDLALGLRPGVDPFDAAESWTARLQRLRPLADHLDVAAGPALYRVFLLSDSQQVDLSFWPDGSFASTGEPFELLFGEAGAAGSLQPPESREIVGWAWLYALHARSALARGRPWQALQMVDDLRGRLVALACLRHGLPPHQGRGVDRLPTAELERLAPAVPAGPDGGSVLVAFTASIELLSAEVDAIDPRLAERLRPALAAIRTSVRR